MRTGGNRAKVRLSGGSDKNSALGPSLELGDRDRKKTHFTRALICTKWGEGLTWYDVRKGVSCSAFCENLRLALHFVPGSNVHKMGSVFSITSEIFVFWNALHRHKKKRIRSGSKVLVTKDGGLGLRISFYWLLASISTRRVRIKSVHFSPFTLADVATRFGHDFCCC